MAQFYKELKELRIKQDISLEEISDRTKIHIQYLNAIENGDFKNIEIPYLRLFLRAYSEEIGGNSQRSLEQLDSFMGHTRARVRNTIHIEETDQIENEDEAKGTIFSLQIDKNKRDEIIKGGLFSLIFIFSIIISQKIFNQQSNAVVTYNGAKVQNRVKPISDAILKKDYLLDQSIEELINVKPPFFVKIKALDQVGYIFSNDKNNDRLKILNSNMEKDLDEFIEKSELLFSSTESLNIYINSFEVKNLTGSKDPVKLIIKPYPPSIEIQKYKLLK